MKFGLRDVSKRTEGVPGAEAEPALPGSSLASSASVFTAPEGVARSARQRLWAADVACYYAQRRFSQTGRAADRLIWESCQQETQNALAAVREAERARAK
jgi:hypothetical protein